MKTNKTLYIAPLATVMALQSEGDLLSLSNIDSIAANPGNPLNNDGIGLADDDEQPE